MLQRSLASRFVRHRENEETRRDEQCSRRIHRRSCVEVSKHGDDGLSAKISDRNEGGIKGVQDVIRTAMTPKMRFDVAVSALPVPLWGVGNSSGVYPYSTAYMVLLQKLKAQFQPRSCWLVVAVVDAYRNAPVAAVDAKRAPFRPMYGSSMSTAPSRDPGMPSVAMMRLLRYVMYVLPSSNSAPRVAWMYGRKALYSGYPRPMRPQTAMMRPVLSASFLVEKRVLICLESIFWR